MSAERRVVGDAPLFVELERSGGSGFSETEAGDRLKQDQLRDHRYTGFNARWKAQQEDATAVPLFDGLEAGA